MLIKDVSKIFFNLHRQIQKTMKKIITLFFFASFAALQSDAQTTGSDSYGYVWRNSFDITDPPTYTWFDITTIPSAVQVTGLADDNTVGPFIMTFPFHYYWYDVNKFWIGSNGYVIFTNGQISSGTGGFPAMPSTAAPNDFVAPFMCDLIFAEPGDTAECWYWMNNSADTLIVSWIGVPFWQPVPPATVDFTGSNSFQVVFATVDSSITFNYKQQVGVSPNPANNMSIGIENNSGLIGDQNYLNAYPPINFSIKYHYPPTTAFVVNDASTLWANNMDNGGIFLSKGGAVFPMNGEVKNVGNQPLSPFIVNAKITGPVPSVAIKAQDNFTTIALAPSDTQLVSYTNTFNPTQSGVYNYKTVTQSPGDVFPGNDTAKIELHVVDTTAQDILLTYDDGTNDIALGLSWQGGNGGGANYFRPPYYPAEINALRYFIVGDSLAVGYTAKVFADDGPGGAAGTELFTYTQGPVATALAWDTIIVDPPVMINSGGFYVAWIMGGNSVALGHDQSLPISNRSYEILSGSWAIYRFRDAEDLMINAIMTGNFGVGINESTKHSFVSRVYPNPVNDRMNLSFSTLDGKEDIRVMVTDVQGKILLTQTYASAQVSGTSASINVSGLGQGIYLCEVKSASGISRQKFALIR